MSNIIKGSKIGGTGGYYVSNMCNVKPSKCGKPRPHLEEKDSKTSGSKDANWSRSHLRHGLKRISDRCENMKK
jgi:hypothetical protein